jgi:hypothetical protein
VGVQGLHLDEDVAAELLDQGVEVGLHGVCIPC